MIIQILSFSSIPECDDSITDGPANDKGGGSVQGDLAHVRDAGGQPDIQEGDLQQREVEVVRKRVRQENK